MKLITEEISKVKFITEEKNGKKSLYIEGIFLQADIKNRNGRCYPMETLAREVTRYTDNYISKGRALGELGHPDGPTVNLDRVSHMITSLREDGNNFVVKAKILDTPMGKIASSLISEGVKLGVSSRGIGSLVEKNGVRYVSNDFMLATAADIVADPSAPDAFVNGIMEGVEWIYDVSRNSWLLENAKKKINHLVDTKQLDERKIQLFDEFLNSL